MTNREMCLAEARAVYRTVAAAVSRSEYPDVYKPVYEAVGLTVERAGNVAVYRAVGAAIDQPEEPPHPGWAIYLGGVGE